MSQYSWVACGRDVYVLECLRNGYIKIEPMVTQAVGDALYIAHYHPTLPSSAKLSLGAAAANTFLRKRKILTADSLQMAIKGCDTYAASKIMHGNSVVGYVVRTPSGRAILLAKTAIRRLLRTALWRKGPATDGQKALIAKRLHLKEPDALSDMVLDDTGSAVTAMTAVQRARKPISLETLTKGEAANVLSRVFHGALRNYSEKARLEVRAEEAGAKRRKKEELQTVRVGPLPI